MTEHAYIHIPFCKRKCKYCSFVSGFDISLKETYLNALKKEIKTKYKNEELKTLYFGGGTPSLLTPDDIYSLISLFKFQKDAGITLEANPETVELNKFKEFKDAGVNRISLGVQTFDNNLLSLIGRCHNKNDIINAVETIKNAGFVNFGIDLIYGLPNQSIDLLKSDMAHALSLEPKHISLYGLKIEEGSYFYDNPPANIPDLDMQADMYELICGKLKEAGFEHREISNFSKPGYESRHNLAYWKNKNYYGFGLNASGYEGKTRYTNTSDFALYVVNPFELSESRELCEKEIIEEEIFLALRLKEGVDIQKTNKKFGIDFETFYGEIIKKYKDTKFIKYEEGKSFALSEEGFVVASEIMSEFLL